VTRPLRQRVVPRPYLRVLRINTVASLLTLAFTLLGVATCFLGTPVPARIADISNAEGSRVFRIVYDFGWHGREIENVTVAWCPNPASLGRNRNAEVRVLDCGLFRSCVIRSQQQLLLTMDECMWAVSLLLNLGMAMLWWLVVWRRQREKRVLEVGKTTAGSLLTPPQPLLFGLYLVHYRFEAEGRTWARRMLSDGNPDVGDGGGTVYYVASVPDTEEDEETTPRVRSVFYQASMFEISPTAAP
jgi:hypothetical protein